MANNVLYDALSILRNRRSVKTDFHRHGLGIPAKLNAFSEREAERHSGMNPNTIGA